MRIMTVCLIALALSGCAAAASKPVPPSAYCPKPDPRVICAGWSPIITHADDLKLMDPRTIEEIDAHNGYGLARGCWKQGGGAQ